MKKGFLFTMLVSIFIGIKSFCQSEQKSNIEFGVSCIQNGIDFATGAKTPYPRFILYIRNNGLSPIKINQYLLFGHSGDENYNDVTFEILRINGGDSINILEKVLFTRISGTELHNKVILIAGVAHFFECTELTKIYFRQPGKYIIRFELLKKYAPEYLKENLYTDWMEVELPLYNEAIKKR